MYTMEKPQKCPVVVAIESIRGGFYGGETQCGENNLVKLGGSDSSSEFICDDMTFYMMQRKMELARFELSRPDAEQQKIKCISMFRDTSDATYYQIYVRLIDRALKKKYIYDQFVQMIDLIDEMEQLVAARVELAGRKGIPINISIPNIFFLPHIDQVIIYRPDVLADTINKIIDYMNNLNLNAILKTPIMNKIAHVDKFTGQLDMTARIDAVDGTLEGMHSALNKELEVATYIREIEKYQCGVINHVNNVYDKCKKIIDSLVI